MPKIKPPVNDPEKVREFMEKLDHPFKAEVEALREIIKGVDPAITEEIKWNAPSYGYVEHFLTFNLHATKHVHLVFHNGAALNDTSGLLEGDYVDRRMAYFTGMDDVKAKRPALEGAVRSWLKLMDAKQ